MKLINVLLVGCGGFLGAAGRYLCSGFFSKLSDSPFPIGTFLVNVIGSFLIGLLSEGIAVFCPDQKRLLLFLTTGIMGGFTTFSTFSLETLNLFQNGHAVWGILNIILSITCCLAGVFLGKGLIQLIHTLS